MEKMKWTERLALRILLFIADLLLKKSDLSIKQKEEFERIQTAMNIYGKEPFSHE